MEDDNEIMVIESKLLFQKKYFSGFISHSLINYESIILQHHEWLDRKIAESNYSYKQPIGYSVIYNPKIKKLFLYQRSQKTEYYKERRLHGKYSCGIGGHIEKFDVASSNPLNSSVIRELSEEIKLNEAVFPNTIGYINDDSDDVGKVHFGILYIIEFDGNITIPENSEIIGGEFVSLDEYDKICNISPNNIENWSRIILNPLKEYINRSTKSLR